MSERAEAVPVSPLTVPEDKNAKDTLSTTVPREDLWEKQGRLVVPNPNAEGQANPGYARSSEVDSNSVVTPNTHVTSHVLSD